MRLVLWRTYTHSSTYIQECVQLTLKHTHGMRILAACLMGNIARCYSYTNINTEMHSYLICHSPAMNVRDIAWSLLNIDECMSISHVTH